MPGFKPGHDTGCFVVDIRLRDLATCCARGLHFVCPLENRGRREDRVRAAPAVSRAIAHRKSAHEHTGSAETLRPSLRNGFTAYFVLSPVNGSFATVAPEKLASQELDASTAASGPHDFAVRFSHPRQSWHPRPPQPVPTFVTMADAPLVGTGWRQFSFDLPDGLSGIFLREGLDRLLRADLPVGQIPPSSRSRAAERLGNDGAASGANSDKRQLGSWNHCPASSIGFLTQLLFGET